MNPVKNIELFISKNKLNSYESIYQIHRKTNLRRWFWGIWIGLVLIMFLPWTQNIRAKGKVTALYPNDRPQEINSIISGKIAKWYKKEGDYVKEGDTILILTEVKAEYLDPMLLEATKQQMIAKQSSAAGYSQKATMADVQNEALEQAKRLKLESLDNKIGQQLLKIKNDSAELMAIEIELSTYTRQYDAAKKMFENGAISLTEFEKRTVNFQNGQAKKNVYQNKLMQSRQELTNLYIEKNSAIQEYNDKIAKTQGEKYSSLANAASSDADVAKLKNQFNSYKIRNEMYIVRAPQSGQLMNAHKSGIGEIVKEGEKIIDIVPEKQSRAVEIFVDPVDIPLIKIGQDVRFVFDGFPALVFSGWPESSFGIFGGKVAAVESNVSQNGKYRVLVAEDAQYKPWPKALRMGNGAQGIALLNNVLVGYEIWRNINGFPPEYYQDISNTNAQADSKK